MQNAEWTQHPDAPLEEARLTETLALIAHETKLFEKQEARQRELFEDAMRTMGDDIAAIELRHILYQNALQALVNLRLAADKPYFTRVDFREQLPNKALADPETFYIGKYGVLRSDTLYPAIIDWRSPVANLYYSGQIGPVEYKAPDGIIRGELTLKRQFAIEEHAIQGFFDADIVAQEAYLQSVLGGISSDRLKDIVTTIQAEQNLIIRYPFERSLVVQGVAGSGKTTIALHRIAYLLYALRERMLPEQMMILAPNPLFLDYISAVLPELGVEKVKQWTFHALAREVLGARMPQVQTLDVVGLRVEGDAMADSFAAECKLKGSRAFYERLRDWLAALPERFLPKQGIRFGPVPVFQPDELCRFFLEDLSRYPIAVRIEQVEKQIKKRTRAAHQRVKEIFEEQCEQRAELLRRMPEGEAKRERLRTLYNNRDVRLQEAEAAAKTFVKTQRALWKTAELMECFTWFWEEAPDEWGEARDRTLSRLKEKKVIAEDLGALVLIALRVHASAKPIRLSHVVLDEAQDFSVLEYETLKTIAPYASFTIVGDLMQGVHAYRGIGDWQEVLQCFPGSERLDLVTSYRNTVEIMELANHVAEKHAFPGQQTAVPVLRHGEAPEICGFASAAERNKWLVKRIKALQCEGMNTIAVIEKTKSAAKRLYDALRKQLSVSLIDSEQTEYRGGVMILATTAAKGLEFDAVLIADASEARFADTEADARLLYVCLTRPLHRLSIGYIGECSALLRERAPITAGTSRT